MDVSSRSPNTIPFLSHGCKKAIKVYSLVWFGILVNWYINASIVGGAFLENCTCPVGFKVNLKGKIGLEYLYPSWSYVQISLMPTCKLIRVKIAKKSWNWSIMIFLFISQSNNKELTISRFLLYFYHQKKSRIFFYYVNYKIFDDFFVSIKRIFFTLLIPNKQRL